MKMTDREFRDRVASIVAEGGWSSVVDILELVPIKKLRAEFDWIDGDEYDEEEE